MIISASRRTDIPAFYSEWFINRIRAGFCLVPNPFNANQLSQVSLAPEDVDAIVFWSKNPQPMLRALPELDDRGFTYAVLYTLNDYPSAFEPGLPSREQRLQTFRELARSIGPERVVWRYDPLIISPATGYEAHACAFEGLAHALQGATRRVFVSILEPYRKTLRRMGGLAEDGYAVDLAAGDSPDMQALLSRLSEIARSCGIEPLLCAGARDFSATGFHPGRCIDDAWLASMGVAVADRKDPGQRPHCRCVVSRDVGVSDTCLHGCPYCYATRSDPLARRRHSQHDPDSPQLFGSAIPPGADSS